VWTPPTPASEAEAWWQVDLARSYEVRYVTLWSADGAAPQDFVIEVLDGREHVIATVQQTEPLPRFRDFALDGARGRAVRVRRKNPGALSLAEVQVWATLGSAGSAEPPLAAGDVFTTTMDQALTVPAPGVLANDTGGSGAVLAAELEAGPAQGTLALQADGSFHYTPPPGHVGTQTFTYSAKAGVDFSNVATVTLLIEAPETPPPPDPPPPAAAPTTPVAPVAPAANPVAPRDTSSGCACSVPVPARERRPALLLVAAAWLLARRPSPPHRART